jgi:peptidoglycan/xylan/chitin deacetylase (PgdA/CDA1 family)
MNTMMTTANAHSIPILTYHQIAEAPLPGAPFRSLYVTPERFKQQLTWLQRFGYQGLSMRDLMPYLKGEKQGKVVGITLDDGYLNNYTDAMPLLLQHGFTATCYVVSQLLGRSNEWDHAIGIRPALLMGAQQIKGWADAGMEIGAISRPVLLSLWHLRQQASPHGEKCGLRSSHHHPPWARHVGFRHA